MAKWRQWSGPGPGVDALGQPVIDPTKNVDALVEAAIKRQDDLREVAAAHLRELAELRASYDRELREAESQRIDAIRAVDVEAVRQAAAVAATQATVLASQLAATAEAARTAVQAASTASDINLRTALEPIQKDIQDLRKAQYEAQGVRTQAVETMTGGRSTTLIVIAAVSVLVAVISLATSVGLALMAM